MSFYRLLADYYDDLFPLNPAALAFLRSRFKEAGANRLLDLACGSGNYTLALSREGFAVTGLDLDQEMIRLAKEKSSLSRKEAPQPEFILGDMLKLSKYFPGLFQGVFCIGNSLVHLDTMAKLKAGIDEVAEVLEPGGIFLVQVVNYDRILAEKIEELPPLKPENKDIVFRRFYDYDEKNDVINFTGELAVTGRGTFQNTVPLLPLTRKRFLALLRESRFTGCRFQGSFAGEEWKPSSPATILTARRPG